MAQNNAQIHDWQATCQKGDNIDQILKQARTANFIHPRTTPKRREQLENKPIVHMVVAAGTLHSANDHRVKKTDAQIGFVGSWTQFVGKRKAEPVAEDDIDLEDGFQVIERIEAEEDFEVIGKEERGSV